MKILVINAGSSSLKFQLLESENFNMLYKGMIDEIGKKSCRFHEEFKKIKNDRSATIANYDEALHFAIKTLIEKKIIKQISDIGAIGHRVVHGGEKYHQATILTPKVIQDIKNLCELAPLHNPHNLAAILSCKKIFKKIAQVAVFDTGFHQTIPEKAFLYALPYSHYEKMGIRKYGFHGTSHAYVSHETIKLLKKKNSKIIVCHLGNGSSITGIKDGKSVDTSMGFTPLEGIPMGTRCGDIDPAIIFHLIKKLKKSPEQISEILNRESGLKGLSMKSSDVRELWAKKNSKETKRAFEVLAYRIAKYIGAYTAAMNGVDAITFTGGIGENAWYLREDICAYLSYLSVQIDTRKNTQNAQKISNKKSKIEIFIIPTNEEKQIAIEAIQQIKNI